MTDTDADTIIKFDNVVKRFDTFTVIDWLDFEVKRG